MRVWEAERSRAACLNTLRDQLSITWLVDSPPLPYKKITALSKPNGCVHVLLRFESELPDLLTCFFMFAHFYLCNCLNLPVHPRPLPASWALSGLHFSSVCFISSAALNRPQASGCCDGWVQQKWRCVIDEKTDESETTLSEKLHTLKCLTLKSCDLSYESYLWNNVPSSGSCGVEEMLN